MHHTSNAIFAKKLAVHAPSHCQGHKWQPLRQYALFLGIQCCWSTNAVESCWALLLAALVQLAGSHITSKSAVVAQTKAPAGSEDDILSLITTSDGAVELIDWKSFSSRSRSKFYHSVKLCANVDGWDTGLSAVLWTVTWHTMMCSGPGGVSLILSCAD